jgi:hypothetical protein
LPNDVSTAEKAELCSFELNNDESMFIFSLRDKPSKIYTWSTDTWRDATPMNTFDQSKYIIACGSQRS